jgi:hypothetical protein
MCTYFTLSSYDYIAVEKAYVVLLLLRIEACSIIITRRSKYFKTSHQRTHIFHIHDTIIVRLTLLKMNLDRCHTMQEDKTDDYTFNFCVNITILRTNNI